MGAGRLLFYPALSTLCDDAMSACGRITLALAPLKKAREPEVHGPLNGKAGCKTAMPECPGPGRMGRGRDKTGMG